MVDAVRTAEKALGGVSYETGANELKNRKFRRSLFVVENIAAGETFTEVNVRSIRPGDGLHPRHLLDVIGKKAAADIARGTPLSWNLLAK